VIVMAAMAEGRVQALPVVEHLDVGEHRRFRSRAGTKAEPVDGPFLGEAKKPSPAGRQVARTKSF
jgi:hypothetical protein